MDQTLRNVAGLFMMVSIAVSAEESEVTLPQLGQSYSQYQWQRVDVRMSPREYGQVTRHNRRVLADATRDALERRLSLLGVPDSVAGLAGGAAGLAIDGAALPLNESETVTLELEEVTEQNRTMLLKWKFTW